MKIETVSDFRKAIRSGPYAWPGGYPLYFITDDGEAVSFNAARTTERRWIVEAIGHKLTNGYRVVAMDINYEDEDLVCCITNERIESAYGDR